MIIAVVAVVLFLSLVATRSFWPKQRDHGKLEPPIIYTKIPLLGHIIGMILRKKNFYEELRNQCSQPIVTLPMLGSRVYVVFSVPVIQAIQKESKALAFQPIQARFSVRLCGASRQAYRILQRDMECDGEYGNIYTAMHRALAPGESLNDMSRVMIGRVREFVEGIPSKSTVRLDEWLRHHVTQATTDAVYGPHNPFRDLRVERAFWEFERTIPQLIFLPSWLARRGARNRKVVADAFEEYFFRGQHEEASDLVRDFYESECSYGFSLSDRARFEVGLAVANLANTYAAVFWMAFYVFSNPAVLEEIRREVSSIIKVVVDGPDDGSPQENGAKQRRVLDMTKVNSYCPLLVSTFRESIRLHSVGISLREVCRDTVVSDAYLLKKGATVLMPTIAIHTDPRIWGADVLSFRHDRFLNPEKRGGSRGDRVSAAAFRSFGGGTTLCPGRHFATTQILVWICLLVLRFDMRPTSGHWAQPKTEKSNLANVIMRPDDDIEVELTSRGIYEDTDMDVRITSQEAMLSVTVEDLKEDAETLR
ncbi:cytochrome P450 [Hypomontagnella monticulosa]|nr:cytochrome P450 [Hypomontagnella monticulosa]